VNNTSYRSKRAVDMVTLALGVVPAAIVGLAAALWVKTTSPGPVLFRQTRAGLDGTEFECLKFRTMLHGDNPLIPDDSRITSAGRWLRRFSLDELPQLLNVARGEMNIVGPRPMLPFQFDRCNSEQVRRFSVRPGLTGWAQINGRNGLTWPERIELDLEYVDRQSAAFDLRIMLGTAGALLGGDGVEGHDATDPFVTQPEPRPDA
jgi:lipopolysaccharide/colanic/teichoic acid biosynthesis glycosyltransferase